MSEQASDEEMARDNCGMLSSEETGTGYIAGDTFESKEVTYAVVDGEAIFEGCIILGSAEELAATSKDSPLGGESAGLESIGITGERFRWPNACMPYTIDPSLPNQERVTDAIQHWRDNTKMQFVYRTSKNEDDFPDWVTFTTGGGCSASVGRRGVGQQFIRLANGCSTGNTIHEIGHALGLWHEQSREDRNSNLEIHFDNIRPEAIHNFNQHITDGDDMGSHDFGSIMHYGSLAFSRNGLPTITTKPAGQPIGQRAALSAGDIAGIHQMYGL